MQNRRTGRFFLALLAVAFTAGGLRAQNAVVAAGGSATGSGSASYSVGQLLYEVYSGSTGSVAQGVQQPYEISVETGVNELPGVELTLSVYPNPVTDYLTLRVDAMAQPLMGSLTYSLHDVQGRVLCGQKLADDQTRIVMGQYPPAVYFLRVSDGGKLTKTFKIIKN